MDDTNILTLGKNTSSITKKLRWIHSRCLGWAKRYGALFSLEKYSLLYINKRRKKEREKEKLGNLTNPIYLDNIPITPSSSIRVLGVYLSSNLSWIPNTEKLKEKALERLGVLSKSTFSTRGFPPLVARVVYIAALRAILSYGSGVWANPINIPKGITNILGKEQNKALRVILGAFKSTPISLLEREAFIPPLDLYLKARATNFTFSLLENKKYTNLLRETTKDLSRYLGTNYKDPLIKKERDLKDYLITNNLLGKELSSKLLKSSFINKWKERELISKYNRDFNIFSPFPSKKALGLLKDIGRIKGSLLL